MNRYTLQRTLRKPFMTYLFLGIQTLVFLVAFLFPGLNVESRGSMFGPFVVYTHEYWRFFTPMFIHFGLMHFAVNSVVLYFMGQQVEAIYGHWRFAVIYLMSGAMGNLMSFALNQMGIQSAGSSTALFGLFGAFIVLGIHFRENPAIQGMVRQFALFVAMSFLFSIFDRSVDIWGHIGGLLGGILLGNLLALPKNSRSFETKTRVLSGIILVILAVFFLIYGFKKYTIPV